ncbi:hypothetical protein [Paenibacillus sp. FSL R5-0914]|uniref:hypothetical protein n=1 Tax=Paenibacillus sp. FSL R5-0914 TaxID=2921665 RepID=UPI0030FB5567
MRLSLLGISISLFGIALILTSSGSATVLGLGVSFLGLIVSLIACFRGEHKA